MPKVSAPKIKTKFEFKAPAAKTVSLVGDFTGWQDAPLEMKKNARSGIWSRTISLAPGRYEYRLLVDGAWQDDPNCPHRQPNQFGGQNCVCVVTAEVTAPAA